MDATIFYHFDVCYHAPYPVRCIFDDELVEIISGWARCFGVVFVSSLVVEFITEIEAAERCTEATTKGGDGAS